MAIVVKIKSIALFPWSTVARLLYLFENALILPVILLQVKALRNEMLKAIIQTQRPPAALQNSLVMYQVGRSPSQRKRVSKVLMLLYFCGLAPKYGILYQLTVATA
jgi:hypothetical protein